MQKGFAPVIVLVITAIVVVGVGGYLVFGPEKESAPAIDIGECAELEDDICGLFGCVVKGCWCNDATPEGAIVFEAGKRINSKSDALAVVKEYLDTIDSEYIGDGTAAELNDIFYNVFLEDSEGYEQGFTVSADGVVFKTICGV